MLVCIYMINVHFQLTKYSVQEEGTAQLERREKLHMCISRGYIRRIKYQIIDM